MFAAIGKYVGGKVLTAALVVAAAGGVIWFWRHPEDLQRIWSVLKSVLVWMGLVIVLPWAGYFGTAWVVRRESNVAAAVLLVVLTGIDAVFAFYLANWSVNGVLSWTVMLLGLLCAAVYNFVVCDYQAGRLEESL